MADKKFSQFTATSALALGDFVVGLVAAGGAGSNRKTTIQQIAALLQTTGVLAVARGSVTVGASAETAAITFSTPLGSVPTVIVCTGVMPTSAGANFFPTIIEDTITGSGFTASFAPPGSAGHKIFYVAYT